MYRPGIQADDERIPAQILFAARAGDAFISERRCEYCGTAAHEILTDIPDPDGGEHTACAICVSALIHGDLVWSQVNVN